MKQISRLLSLASVAALCFSACTEELNNDKINGGKTVTVHFGTENTDPSTKATLTPNEGETAFQAAWENGDKIAVKYTYVADNISEAVPGTWDASTSKFSAEIQDLTEGEKVLQMKYQASYPYSTDGYVDFGSVRTQTGAAYNSIYDLMVAEPVTVTAKPGLDESGNAIVFPMQRQTAIAYFHFTSDNTEAITKATLKVEGENAAIAAKTVLLDPTGMDYETGLSEIVLTTTDQKADDFTLWFNVLPTTYTKMTLTVETATKTFTISKKAEGKYMAGKLYKVNKGIEWTDKLVTDVITADKLKATSTSYTDFSGVKISSNAVYAGNNAKTSDGAIQLRSEKSTAGIVSTTSGGKVTKVSVEWASKTTNGRVINVYGNTNPYTSASELYSTTGNTNQGTNLGTIVCGTSTELVINGDYPYIGIRSNSGALYLNSVSITWESGSSEPAPDTYTVSCATVPGGTLSASPSVASAGTEVTLTATPDAGYAFNNGWTVKDADKAEITVNEGKFIMPAKDVTVSGSFSKVDYTITKATCEGGSFTVKKNGVEVTKAQVGDVITLDASAAEGYEFDSWTVTNESTSKTVYVSENSFTMPGANVTVSANFLKVYASVADLIAAGTPTSEGANVTVTLSNEEITKFYITKAGDRRGVYFTVETQEIELFGDIACPEEWVAGGWVSGTLTKCKWMLYNNTWELCLTDWTELTYAAPCETPDITLDGAVATITCATEGATIHYTLDGKDPLETSDVYTAAVTLTDGQTIKAKAFLTGHKPSEVASKTYSSTGGETKSFIKLKSSLTDYSGEYLMLHSNDYVVSGVSNKKLATVALEPNVGDQIMESEIPASAAVLTIEASTKTGYYTIKFSDGKYLCWSEKTDFSTSTTADTDNYLWSISITNSSATITNKKDTNRIIKWYASNKDFRPYTTQSYDLPVLYKKN